MSNPEIQPANQEHGAERTAEAAGAQLEKLRNRQEKAGEQQEDSEARVSAERKSVEAAFGKEKPIAEKASSETAKRSRSAITSQDKKTSFTQTMKRVQTEMTPAERTFSRFIHSPAVEKSSEAIGKTIARPNAILTGSVFAFVLVLAAYFLARNYGFRLSGFETIGAFMLGWAIGLIYDYVRVLAVGKHS